MTGRRAAPGMPKEPCPLFMIAGRRATYQLPGVLVRASPLLLDNPTPDLVGLAYTWQDGGRLQLLLCILLSLPLTSFCTPRAERWPYFVITLIYDKTHVCIRILWASLRYIHVTRMFPISPESIFFLCLVQPGGNLPIGHERSRWRETRKTHYPRRYRSVYFTTTTSRQPIQPCSLAHEWFV